MIRPGNHSLKVYLHAGPVDMRKQVDGLACLVEQGMQLKPFEKSLFVFTNKRRDKLKILYWEKSGFVVWYKRLESARFCWGKALDTRAITVKELNMLLDGYDIFNFKPHSQIVKKRIA